MSAFADRRNISFRHIFCPRRRTIALQKPWILIQGLLLLAAPALAQLPNGTAAGPDAPQPPVSAPISNAPDTDAPAVAGPETVPPKRLPQVELDDKGQSGSINHPHFDGPQLTYGGELTLSAGQADADLAAGTYDLRGYVRIHETDTTLQAQEVTFNGRASSGVATDAAIYRSYFTIRAPRIAGTPELITAYGGDFATVPNGGPADLYLRSQTITLDSGKRRGTLRNATVYLFGARLVTIKRLSFGFGGPGGGTRRAIAVPTVGYSLRYGTFIAFGNNTRIMRLPLQYRLLLPTRQTVQAALTSAQTLYTPRVHPTPAAPYTGPTTLLDRLRAAATVSPGPLPEGDPLRFTDFLPDPNPIQLFNAPSHGGLYLGEDLSTHVASSGRLRNDLYVSRLPEASLSGDIPLTPVPKAPIYGDPQAFRASLRHIVLYAQARETIGYYREQLSSAPYHIYARRISHQAGLATRPLLIAPNTVLLPSISITTNSYSGGKTAYRYDQINVAVNHYFSPLTAVGLQFLASSTSGDSPFDFDVLDTSRELDLRFQTGNVHLVAAGRIRYDLARGGVIDYQAALGPALRGLIPVLSYNFRTRSVGLGIEIKGFTF